MVGNYFKYNMDNGITNSLPPKIKYDIKCNQHYDDIISLKGIKNFFHT